MAKKTTRKRTNIKPAAQKPLDTTHEPASEPLPLDTVTEPTQAPEAPETPETDVLTPAVVTELTLKDILLVYNSITPSRRRWIFNRNELRNRWKELFLIMEQASGRSGQKADLFDYNWHELVDKGGAPGLSNKRAEDVIVLSGDQYAAPNLSAENGRIAELEAEIVRLSGIIEDITADNQGKEDGADETTPVEKAGQTPQTEATTTVSE